MVASTSTDCSNRISSDMPPLVSLQDAIKQQQIVSSGITPIRGFGAAEQSVSLRDQLKRVQDTKQLRLDEVPPPAPVVLCKPPATSLRRHLSEPAVAAKQTRRAIFHNYWNQEERIPDSPRMRPITSQAPVQGRPRSASLQEECYPNYDLCFRDFCPPRGCAVEHREHYGWVENLPEQSEASLPPLPVPLQRFYSDGRVSSLRGMYPMVSVKPILRQSSYRNLKQRTALSVSDSAGVRVSFNLTRSGRSMARTVTDVKGQYDEDTSETSSYTSSCSNGRRGVSFDPRITVTEFEDNLQRTWFSDADLDRFRMETVVVAQKYLLKHPEMIEVYSKPRLDPITGTMRKKALYSMPALSSVDTDDIQEPEGDVLRYRKAMKELAYHEVKKILVVDRNNLILDLFRRSLHSLFPHAQIVTAQSSEEALCLFCKAIPQSQASPRTAFDIVIAEERLHLPLTDSRTPVLTSGKSCGQQQTFGQLTERSASLQDLSNCAKLQGFPGSELLRRISNLEDTHAANAQSSAEASSWFEPGIWRALLIGVSVYPKQDEPHLRESGADLVWSKPPPRMDESLRDEIVARLIKKRENLTGNSLASESRS